jgi:hypothetical protein
MLRQSADYHKRRAGFGSEKVELVQGKEKTLGMRMAF